LFTVKSRTSLQDFIKNTAVAVRIVLSVLNRIGKERVAQSAAGMAYYGFFSLFPLMLILVTFGSAFLQSREAQAQILHGMIQFFPFSGELIEKNIEQVLSARGSMRVLGAIALAWSGSGAFAILARNINAAWPNTDQHPFVKRRLMALLILVVLIMLMVLILGANLLARLLPAEVNGAARVLMQMRYFSHFAAWLLLFITLLTLYRWIPNTKVAWNQGAWGALVASLAAEIVTLAFTWYLRSGFAKYSLVYGSLGAVAALLFWIYLLSFMVLFGAYLSAEIAMHRLAEEKP
jgi:membrane protein